MPQILIAEDDAEDRYILTSTFEELGFGNIINFVEDGAMLIDYLTKTGVDSIGLIVLDLNMPKLTGTETLRIIKTMGDFVHIPVVIFSTSINEIEKKNCMDLGAKEYITKPTKYAEYIETCKKFYSLASETINFN